MNTSRKQLSLVYLLCLCLCFSLASSPPRLNPSLAQVNSDSWRCRTTTSWKADLLFYKDVANLTSFCTPVHFPSNMSLFFSPSNLSTVHLGSTRAHARTQTLTHTQLQSVLPVLLLTPPSCPFGLAKSVSHTTTLFINSLILLSSQSVSDHHNSGWSQKIQIMMLHPEWSICSVLKP